MIRCKICSEEIANYRHASLYRKVGYCIKHLPVKLKCSNCNLPKYKEGLCKYCYKKWRKSVKLLKKVRCAGTTKTGRQCRNLVHPELIYCNAHKNKEQNLSAKDYHKYIQSKEWARKSKQKRNEYGNRCRLCNATGLLHTHHRTYARLGKELPEDLTPLCEPCHNEFHRTHTYDSKTQRFIRST